MLLSYWTMTSPLTLYPTGRSWQSCVHPLTRRFKHSFRLQFFSSDRSPQSSLPSQRFPSEMQRPLEHMKKEPLHKLPEKSKTWLSLAQCPVISHQSWGMVLTWQWISTDKFLSVQERSPGCSAFCFCHMSQPVSWASGASGDTDEEILAESQTAVLPAARHLRFRGSSSEWSGQSAWPSHSHWELRRQRPSLQRNSSDPQER